MPDVPLDGERILRYLRAVADRLGPTGTDHTIVVVGGSLLALRDLRRSTVDVDSVRRLDAELTDAIALVASDHGLAPRWLNDRAVMFRPATLHEEECSVELHQGRLVVLGAPLEQVFLMKLYASRAPDLDDMIGLWPLCGFASPQAVVEQYYLAYPHAEEDRYLVNHVAAIADAASQL